MILVYGIFPGLGPATSRANLIMKRNSYRLIDDSLMHDGLESAVRQTDRRGNIWPASSCCMNKTCSPRVSAFCTFCRCCSLRDLTGANASIQVDSVASSGLKIADLPHRLCPCFQRESGFQFWQSATKSIQCMYGRVVLKKIQKSEIILHYYSRAKDLESRIGVYVEASLSLAKGDQSSESRFRKRQIPKLREHPLLFWSPTVTSSSH
jgi:hypothetical protein